jgi:hypothetical protein
MMFGLFVGFTIQARMKASATSAVALNETDTPAVHDKGNTVADAKPAKKMSLLPNSEGALFPVGFTLYFWRFIRAQASYSAEPRSER